MSPVYSNQLFDPHVFRIRRWMEILSGIGVLCKVTAQVFIFVLFYVHCEVDGGAFRTARTFQAVNQKKGK